MEITRLLDLYRKGPRVIPDYLTLPDSLRARHDNIQGMTKPASSRDTLNGLFYERPDWVANNFPMSYKDFLWNEILKSKRNYNMYNNM